MAKKKKKNAGVAGIVSTLHREQALAVRRLRPDSKREVPRHPGAKLALVALG